MARLLVSGWTSGLVTTPSTSTGDVTPFACWSAAQFLTSPRQHELHTRRSESSASLGRRGYSRVRPMCPAPARSLDSKGPTASGNRAIALQPLSGPVPPEPRSLPRCVQGRHVSMAACRTPRGSPPTLASQRARRMDECRIRDRATFSTVTQAYASRLSTGPDARSWSAIRRPASSNTSVTSSSSPSAGNRCRNLGGICAEHSLKTRAQRVPASVQKRVRAQRLDASPRSRVGRRGPSRGTSDE